MLSSVCKPKKQCTWLQKNILGVFGISSKEACTKIGRWCQWQRPTTGYHKLNADGSARDGVITGGGVVRDEQGKFIAAFSSFYGNGTNNESEFLALKVGVELCKSLKLSNVVIECDSQMVVDAIRNGKVGHWRLRYLVRHCSRQLPGTYTINHNFRQTNMVTDRLAGWAHIHRARQECFIETTLHPSVRSVLRTYKLGLWNYRP